MRAFTRKKEKIHNPLVYFCWGRTAMNFEMQPARGHEAETDFCFKSLLKNPCLCCRWAFSCGIVLIILQVPYLSKTLNSIIFRRISIHSFSFYFFVLYLQPFLESSYFRMYTLDRSPVYYRTTLTEAHSYLRDTFRATNKAGF